MQWINMQQAYLILTQSKSISMIRSKQNNKHFLRIDMFLKKKILNILCIIWKKKIH